MKNWLFKISTIVVPVVLSVSIVFAFNSFKGTTKNVFENEDEFKLKFVDSTDYELNLSGTSKVVLPIEILSAEEINGSVVLTTYENAVIYSPIDCQVSSVSFDKSEVEVVCNNIRCVISGIITGVKVGNVLHCGDVMGTVKGNRCSIKVFWGTRLLSLEELKGLL